MKTLRNVLLLWTVVGLVFSACAESTSGKNKSGKGDDKIMENQEVIKLKKPDLNKGTNVMQALNVRKSVREYGDKELGLSDLSDLLWAANGINRPETGKRTAPSALNSQDVDVYVCMKEGAYLYDAKEHLLRRVSKMDLRSAVGGGQEFVKEAPLSLVLVSDISRFPGDDKEHKALLGAMDVGIVSQNISLFCASTGLVTVPRASMDTDALKAALKLSASQLPLMNHPIGFGKN